MRRFTGILALATTLLTLTTAQAQQTYTQNLSFQTSNQSMWNAGLGQTGYSFNYPLIQSWDTNGNVGSTSYRRVFLLGRFGAGATVNTRGRAGVNFNAYATSGNVSVNYPLTVNFSYPDPATLAPGQTFTLRSSYTPGTDARLTTQSPDAGLGLDTILQADPMKINLNVQAFSHNIINNDIINHSFNINQRLLDTHNLPSGVINYYNGALRGNFHQPVVNTSGQPAAGTTTIQSGGQDPFFTLTADFSNAVAAFLNQPPFSARFTRSYRTARVTVDYAYLDLYGVLSFNLAQNFQFTPHPMVTLNLSTGQTVTFEAGQSVQLTIPADGSALSIAPRVALNNQFTNRTNIKLAGAVQFNPAEISARLSVAGVRTPSIHFKPLPTYTLFNRGLPGSSPLDLNVYNQTFSLGGFEPQSLPTFTITPPAPPTLTAQNDTYTATNQGDYYTLHIDAPGALANDSGATGLAAVPQNLQLDGNATAYNRFTLNSDGSIDYVRVAGPGQEDFTYQITDSTGRTATATIHIVRP